MAQTFPAFTIGSLALTVVQDQILQFPLVIKDATNAAIDPLTAGPTAGPVVATLELFPINSADSSESLLSVVGSNTATAVNFEISAAQALALKLGTHIAIATCTGADGIAYVAARGSATVVV